MISPKVRSKTRIVTPLVAVFLTSLVHGQSSIQSTNGLHAIVGARIEIGDGHVIEKGTVVIRNGMIVAVAADAAVPRGADVLDGKGLIVYPGFIDAYTTKGYTAPGSAAKTDPDTNVGDFASAFMRQNVRKGIRPEARAIENLSLGDDVLKPYQTSGFTTILVAPSGGDMSGIAALVNLSGRPSRECAVLANVGETIGFGSGGWGSGYPSSLMGHIAQLRQTLLDAQWYRAVERSFAAGGIQRPPSDDALIALQPALSGNLPVIFDADSEGQIERSLDICTEFGLKPMIAGGGEGWKQLEMLKRSGVPVLLSVAFGKDPAVKPKEPAESALPPGGPPKIEPVKLPEAVKSAEPTIPENPAKVAEKVRLYKESLKNPSLLASAGIPFALTTKGTKTPTEFFENLRKAVEAGLSKEAALKGLTIDAAKIFGVDRQLGTLEVGKIANVVVTSGDFLDAKTKVKMLYIDGRKIDPTKTPPPATPRMRFEGENG